MKTTKREQFVMWIFYKVLKGEQGQMIPKWLWVLRVVLTPSLRGWTFTKFSMTDFGVAVNGVPITAIETMKHKLLVANMQVRPGTDTVSMLSLQLRNGDDFFNLEFTIQDGGPGPCAAQTLRALIDKYYTPKWSGR